MRILYLNVIEQHAGWGAEWYMNRALEGLGHETHCIDYRQNRRTLARRLRAAPPCDAVLLQRGDGVPTGLLRTLPRPRFFWASELVARCADQRATLAEPGVFDHVFFRTPACIAAVAAREWVFRQHASILLSAYDPDTFHPLPAAARDLDVVFVGHITPRRRDMLDRLARDGIAVEAVAAFGVAMNVVFNRARIVLNIHAGDYLDTETRVYEVLGSGAFLLSEKLSAESPFGPGELVECADYAELCDNIRYYLSHVQEREQIAHQGHRAARGAHTYAHRATELVRTVESYCRTPGSGRTPAGRLRLSYYAACERLRDIGARHAGAAAAAGR